MEVIINGEKRQIKENTTIYQLLQDLALNPEVTIVEKNRVLIPGKQFKADIIREDDCIELIRYIGGGN
jgi:sulfur carrier protein